MELMSMAAYLFSIWDYVFLWLKVTSHWGMKESDFWNPQSRFRGLQEAHMEDCYKNRFSLEYEGILFNLPQSSSGGYMVHGYK